MKINIIFPEFGLSGGVMVALGYAKALTESGHHVICYGKKMPYFKPRTLRGVAHVVHRLVSNYDVNIALKRCGAFNYETPFVINNKTIRDADVTIATAWCTAFDVDRLSDSKGRKYYFIQGYEIWDDIDKGIQSYKLPLRHIVIAKWIDDILVKEHGCEPATIIHNGVDLKVFKPDTFKRNVNLTISMMYHFLIKKGISDGLKVLEEIHNQYPNIKIIMFGKVEFPEKPDYIDYYKDPEQRVLVGIYQQSDIFLFPAQEEGWGLTIIEAMACGCAVAGTNTGALIEIGVNGENALISTPGMPELLKENVLRLILNRELRRKIEENALKTAQKLGWEDSYHLFEKTLMV